MIHREERPTIPIQPIVLFVAGTDTGVGKTVLSAALTRRFRALGQPAVAIKPIETGCTHDAQEDLAANDGAWLTAASPGTPPITTAPYRFGPPVAPAVAAEMAGLDLRLDDLVEATRGGFRYGNIIVVEGAGGALSPVARDGLGLDLAARLHARVVVAALDTLGTQSQTLLVIEAARHRGLDIGCVILTRFNRDDALVDAQQNARMIREFSGVPVFGPIPFIEGDPGPRIARVEAILGELGIAERLLQ